MKLVLFLLLAASPLMAGNTIPEPLKPWTGWVMWDSPDANCPSPYNDAKTHLCLWPGALKIQASARGGIFSQEVRVFRDVGLALPGDDELWPVDVRVDGRPVPVVLSNGRPMVRLKPGTATIAGKFRWAAIPQKITIPPAAGIIRLSVAGKNIPFPALDNQGRLWLKRRQETRADKDAMEIKAYRLLKDGIPLWLTTHIEIRVSGRSREEKMGTVLPAGWQLSSVMSKLPAAVDSEGKLTVQVRSGTWNVELRSFRTHDITSLSFSADLSPIFHSEYVAFEGDPAFRLLDITGAPQIDPSQTSIPATWKSYPVYQWDHKNPLVLKERMKGNSSSAVPREIFLKRNLWLREKGNGFIYQDTMNGNLNKTRRLDVSPSEIPGRIRMDGKGQLITRNPATGNAGVEIRTNKVKLEAVGRIPKRGPIPAVGWLTDVDKLSMSLHLPPGWRLFFCPGAEQVRGDWVSAWTLLDLFLLLLFSLAAYRLWGVKSAVVVFFGFALSFHEPGAARYSWFFLLMPLALLRVVPEGRMRKLVVWWRNLAILSLILILVPFFGREIQSVLYPQLDPTHAMFSFIQSHRTMRRALKSPPAEKKKMEYVNQELSMEEVSAAAPVSDSFSGGKGRQNYYSQQNLALSPDARIQTGPGIPQWTGNVMSLTWSGPVTASEKIRPILIPPLLRKILVLTMLILVGWMVALMLGVPLSWPRSFKWKRVAAVAILVLFVLPIRAQMPDQTLLKQLKHRLTRPAPCYPVCADISSASLTVGNGRLRCRLEISAMIQTAVPLPGQLPVWSPVSVTVDGGKAIVMRKNGYLWLLVPKGIHSVQLDGMIPAAADWEWSYLLKPHYLTIHAPGWAVTGIGKNNVPEKQIFFSRKVRKTGNSGDDFGLIATEPLVSVQRFLELGMNWHVQTTVYRLSAKGKAISLLLPLLEGEQVLSSDDSKIKDGKIAVSLSADQDSFVWESRLAVTSILNLKAADAARWVETWGVTASPVWHVETGEGTAVYELEGYGDTPLWKPWPGESMVLYITRPEAIPGPTATVSKISRRISVGSRVRKTILELDVNSSLGQDFSLTLPDGMKVETIKRDESMVPVQREDKRLILPLVPQKQHIRIDLKEMRTLGMWTGTASVGLATEAANIKTDISLPHDRWPLFVGGPTEGPAVRFWSIFLLMILVAFILGAIPGSPLSRWEWILLGVGLTQGGLIQSIFIVGWFSLLAFRGSEHSRELSPWKFDFLQLGLVALTCIALGILLAIVYAGLMGRPEMYIVGNGSSMDYLRWYQDFSAGRLPEVWVLSISIWFYRFLMLAWALWLAHSLIKWMGWAWRQFSFEGLWRKLTFRRKQTEQGQSIKSGLNER
ncbi:MAG: hypothetical protein CO090_07695 [Acidobacteria bacterium CG_4_9_14_3_um_filter_49_7]|nr:MAG: hypothetical protein CO090_07695 [Acidobacteria bacterium CG_4_9_14_3_um_filter_49_7]